MGRVFWFAAGVGTAVYGSVKARRVAYRLSPTGLGDQAAALRVGAGALFDDIRAGARVREEQLLDGLGLTDETPPAPPAPAPPPLVGLPAPASGRDTG